MAFCGNCGLEVQDGVKFCPSCGNEIAVNTAKQAETLQEPVRTKEEVNIVMAALSYIIFFVPILTGEHKKSEFIKYHVNQGAILFGVAVAYGILSTVLSSVIKTPITVYGYSTGIYATPGWLITILWVLSLGIFALCVYGIYNAVTGKKKALPVIGNFTIIK
jgi:uncharacterized membrane protein